MVTFLAHTEASPQQVFEPYGGTPPATESSPSTSSLFPLKQNPSARSFAFHHWGRLIKTYRRKSDAFPIFPKLYFPTFSFFF